MKPTAKHVLFLTVILMLAGCGKMIREARYGVPQVREVVISKFKCNCEPIVQESIQDTFVDVFFNYTTARPVKSEQGDLTIVGVINMAEGQSGYSKSSAGGGGNSNFFAATGDSTGSIVSGSYIAGLTAQVYKNGALIATYSVGQNLGGKEGLKSPIAMAKEVAYYLSTVLIRSNEIGQK